MRPSVWFGAAIVVAVGIGACSIDRRGGLIGDGGPRGGRDPIVPGVDAGPQPLDAGPPPADTGPPPIPCATECTGGSYCSEGSCVCPGASFCCSGCTSQPGRTVCNTMTNTCACDGVHCACAGCPLTGDICQADGSCMTPPPPPCGAGGEPCCPGGLCDDMWLYCSGGTTCRACGDDFEPCCPGDRCMGSLRCGDFSDTCYPGGT